MPCDAMRKALIIDTDGSVLGSDGKGSKFIREQYCNWVSVNGAETRAQNLN